MKTKDDLRLEIAGTLSAQGEADRLKGFKDREMFRIDLRQVTGRIGLGQFSQEVTDLAEIVVEEACRLCHAQLRQCFGDPLVDGAQQCPWCACGLGKFGGRELGYASDIELI